MKGWPSHLERVYTTVVNAVSTRSRALSFIPSPRAAFNADRNYGDPVACGPLPGGLESTKFQAFEVAPACCV